MSVPEPQAEIRRCAIYTRKSVQQGLEREFNSLEAQRAICSAYVASQRPKGLIELPKHYDDAAQSGRTLLRPALQELFCDIESGAADVVVIYKIDRLTRTLLDFVRLIDLFEQYRIQFVSVTQNFDTSDSTGRLILNVLLTFAQFEREMASDRLRDKFGAMRARGMFVGGHPPFGYDLVDKKLIVNPAEAKIVQMIFERYLSLKSYVKVARDCRDLGVIRRDRVSKRGHLVKGRQIETASVWHMLGNPVYVGEVRHRGKRFPGIHDAIISRELWDEVQHLKTRRTREKVVQIHRTDLLRGFMFDSYGRQMGVLRDYRMNSSGRRYYISNQTEWGRRHGVRRMRTNADQLEQLVVAAIAAFLVDLPRVRSTLLSVGVHDRQLEKLARAGARIAKAFEAAGNRQVQCALRALIERIELSEERVKIVVRSPEVKRILAWDGAGMFRGEPDEWQRSHPIELLDIPAGTVRMKRQLSLPITRRSPEQTTLPDTRLVSLLKRARAAQAMLEDNRCEPVSVLAKRVRCGPTRFARLVRLNYLAPDIIASILDGTQPGDLSRRRLMQAEIPMDWSLQRRLFGFPDQPDYLKGGVGY